MQIDRREILGVAAALAGGALWSGPAWALEREAAAEFVQATINEVAGLLGDESTSAEKASRLRQIMEARGAMPQIARFVAGPVWRSMSESQQDRFTEAFTGFVSTVYARRFEEYSGSVPRDELFSLGEVRDAGRKGLMVRTTINRGNEAPVNVDWLVTDQPGHIVIADIVIEGISLLVTQREEIGSMLEARNGDVDQLIEHLASA